MTTLLKNYFSLGNKKVMTKMLLPLLELTIINFLSTTLNLGIILKKPQIENAKNISSQKNISLKRQLR